MEKAERFDVVCLNCGVSYQLPQHRLAKAKYCSKACMLEHKKPIQFKCQTCGKEYERYQAELKPRKDGSVQGTKYCSRKCWSDHAWKTPWTSNASSNGYKVKNVGGKQIKEHRHVMANHLGRELFKHETVHHKNGDRSDNSLRNLELWSTSQPYGQRVEDKLKWAEDFLLSYGYKLIRGGAD